MIRTVFCSTLALVAGSAIVCYADAKDDAVAAADKLASGGNYSWKTTLEAGGGGGGGGGRGGRGGGFGFTGAGEGKVANGVASFTTTGDNPRTIYRKGDKTVMQNQDGEWMTMEEMMAARGGGNGGNGGQGRRGNRGGGAGGAQPLPAETVKDALSKAKSLTLADGVYSGDLTEDAAKAAVMGGGRGGRGGRGGNAGGGGNGPEISDAKATIKVWVKGGAVTKYTSHVTGKVSFNGNDRDVDRTTTTEFSDVGSTKVDVPADAAKKLG